MQRNQPENARQGARYDGIDELDPNFTGAGVRVGIVMARFNLDICEGLLSACTDELLALGVARGDIRIGLPFFFCALLQAIGAVIAWRHFRRQRALAGAEDDDMKPSPATAP